MIFCSTSQWLSLEIFPVSTYTVQVRIQGKKACAYMLQPGKLHSTRDIMGNAIVSLDEQAKQQSGKHEIYFLEQLK